MIWYIGGGIMSGLAAYGIFRYMLRQAVLIAFTTGWRQAMEMRDTWDKARTVNAISDEMLRTPTGIMLRKNLHLVN